MINYTQALTRYIGAFVDELAQSGVKRVVVSPGSRSTPIAMLLAEHPEINVMMHMDERSAAFFALGIAKTANEPVAIVCTSGTAAANYFPAIVEAKYARVPLIVITADRPHELRDVGAPQAIDQIDLYGKHVKWFIDLPLPEDTQSMLHYIRTVCSRAINRAKQAPFGPVHLNFPLREPLIPNMEDPLKFARNNRIKTVQVNNGQLDLLDSDYRNIADCLPKKGVIICGPIDKYDEGFANAIFALAEKLQYPILADPLSQLRSGIQYGRQIIDGYDTFLRDRTVRDSLKPELIVRFGAMPISKALSFYLKEHQEVSQMVIDERSGWRDPVASAYKMIYCNETIFCNRLYTYLNNYEAVTDWNDKWVELNHFVKNASKIINESEDSINEGKIFHLLSSLLPDEATVVIGNSMPIRDADSFFQYTKKKIKLLANRGVNGIDGVVSTALGTSVIEKNTYLVIGDLSFYHDLNGLLAAKLHHLKLTIILINNNGGGIFSLLPQKQHPNHFETLFGTPTDLQYEYAVKMYDGTYFSVENWHEFAKAMKVSEENTGLTVIEVFTNREENANLRRNYWDYVSQEIRKLL
ncbi:2-succinyl-5-enolpyruvyl-6-hydroxy-3-cyclohexene-1-carboxylic-acid synthase [Bacillus kwashiorkori]|uniref:2-succinyl-5-enolpyruvyl-6-hydroxy-3- cyclohexene-1-carboxylic-acid synthase n=1 Tax=Bacillus kwashiorkori TaxID=1522318 RepID=UPI000A5CA4E4|nr:2-succinyl-5-enolpyruvyl-6-hydroxy-3-cyclohexene-1-carboxylic-acid synthase [Bacillus kwashiorkori]